MTAPIGTGLAAVVLPFRGLHEIPTILTLLRFAVPAGDEFTDVAAAARPALRKVLRSIFTS